MVGFSSELVFDVLPEVAKVCDKTLATPLDQLAAKAFAQSNLAAKISHVLTV